MFEKLILAWSASLLQCTNTTDVKIETSKMINQLGFSGFGLCAARDIITGEDAYVVIHDFKQHPGWISDYTSMGHLKRDPVVKYASKNTKVVSQARQKYISTQELNRGEIDVVNSIINQSRDHGIKNCVTVPIHTHTLDFGAMCLSSDSELIGNEDYVSRFEAQLSYIGITTYERINQITGTNKRHNILLTDRERDCLAFALIGLKVKVISEKLHISDHTVKHHLDSARKKLKASSYIHAAFIAFTYGLINP